MDASVYRCVRFRNGDFPASIPEIAEWATRRKPVKKKAATDWLPFVEGSFFLAYSVAVYRGINS